ncbi:MAG: rod shape-determining protein MreC [Myxococcales bacterium]|nr:rod shape-determining protein MreC [Myxococcales bacterium]
MTWLRAYRLALLLVIGLLPLLVLRANLRRHEPGAVDATMLRITAPLQRVVTWAAEGVQYVWFGYINLVDTETENRELRGENRRLHGEVTLLRERVADTARLEGLLAFTATAPSPRVGARVVASTMDARQRVVRIYIDRGAADVRVGMPVIAVGGVVGRVARVLQDYADVMLISDPNSALDVVLPRTQGRGILRGGGAEGRYVSAALDGDRCHGQW